jgi:hypothetical protein
VFVPDGRVLLVRNFNVFSGNTGKWEATLSTHVCADKSPRTEALDSLRCDLEIIPEDLNAVLKPTIVIEDGFRKLHTFTLRIKDNLILQCDDAFHLEYRAIPFTRLYTWVENEQREITAGRMHDLDRSFCHNSFTALQSLKAIHGTAIKKGSYLS